jgi:hypothetical protein
MEPDKIPASIDHENFGGAMGMVVLRFSNGSLSNTFLDALFRFGRLRRHQTPSPAGLDRLQASRFHLHSDVQHEFLNNTTFKYSIACHGCRTPV